MYVIAKLTDFGSQLVHFLQRMAQLKDLPVDASDPLDYFGHYLNSGLNFSYELGSGPAFVDLASQTTDFDSYFLYEMGQRTTPAPKPTQQLPSEVREKIAALEANHEPGFVEMACNLLDEWCSSVERR